MSNWHADEMYKTYSLESKELFADYLEIRAILDN